jgi:ABC-2 type transport system permease protein
MITLYKKELNYYLNNPVGYVVIALFAGITNFLFLRDLFITGSVTLKNLFSLLPWLFMIFIPALTMRSFSEEKRANTMEVLLTLPITEGRIVLAKFMSYVTLAAIGLMLTLSLPVAFYFLARVYIPEILVGYFGSLLLAAFYVSLSLFFSSLTKNQIISLLLSVAVLFALLGITGELFTSFLPKLLQDALTFFSPLYHMESFVKGVLDIRSLYYFLSATALFLFLPLFNLNAAINNMKRFLHKLGKVKLKDVMKKGKLDKPAVFAFSVFIFVVTNLLLQPLSLKADMSKGKAYTLSPSTKKYCARLTMWQP